MRKVSQIFTIALLSLTALAAGCSSNATQQQGMAGRQTQKPGFFERLVDRMTERECLVGGFSCPFGLGPANEPCECTDPSGRVLSGRTIK
jgi:hypothetical protein